VADPARAKLPWMLVAASVMLLGLLLYVVFVSWLPAKQRLSRLESELKETSAREAALQARLSAQDPRAGDQPLDALRAERDALARRLAELERELEALRGRRR
jgi:type II secretory pathway component PulM